MSEPLHDIDKLFHDNIEGHSEYPPKNVWDNIEAGLDKTSAYVYKRKYENVKRVAIILLLLMTGILIYEAVSVKRHNDNLTGGPLRGTTGKDADKQAPNNNTGLSSKHQDEEIVHFPLIDSNSSSEKEDRQNMATSNNPAGTNATNETDINIVIGKKNKPGESGNKKVSGSSATSLSASNKIIQSPSAQELLITQSEKFTVSKKNKKGSKDKSTESIKQEGNKRVNSSTENTAVTNTNVKDKQDNLSVSIPQQNAWLRNIVTEKDRTELSVLTIAATNINPVNTFTASNIIKLPVIDPTEYFKAAQKKSTNNTGSHGFYVSLFASPNASWNSLENDKPHQAGMGNNIDDHNEIEKNEHPDLSYTAGMRISYSFNNKLSLQTGFNYTSSSTSIGPKLVFADRDNNGGIRYRLDCSSGYSYLLPKNGQAPNTGDSLVVSDSKNILSYAGIPLAIEYKLVNGKVSVSASAGIQSNILLKGKTTTVFNKGTTAETPASANTEALKSAYFSALTGITGELRVNKRLSLTITPAAQFGLSSINKGASVKTMANYFSVGAGLKFKL